MLYAGDVEEVVLVVIGQVAFHLCGVHAAIGLSHVDGGNTHRGKNVARHLSQREKRRQHDGNNNHEDRERPTKGGLNQIHATG